MKVQLIFLRHAQALDKAPGQTDFDRSLSKKGERQAEKVASFLPDHLLFNSVLCLVSPAKRTRQTFDLAFKKVKGTLDTRYELGVYEGYVSELEQVIRSAAAEMAQKAADGCTIAIVGHNPAISFLAERFGYKSGQPFHTATAVSLLMHYHEKAGLEMEKVLWRFDADGNQ